MPVCTPARRAHPLGPMETGPAHSQRVRDRGRVRREPGHGAQGDRRAGRRQPRGAPARAGHVRVRAYAGSTSCFASSICSTTKARASSPHSRSTKCVVGKANQHRAQGAATCRRMHDVIRIDRLRTARAANRSSPRSSASRGRLPRLGRPAEDSRHLLRFLPEDPWRARHRTDERITAVAADANTAESSRSRPARPFSGSSASPSRWATGRSNGGSACAICSARTTWPAPSEGLKRHGLSRLAVHPRMASLHHARVRQCQAIASPSAARRRWSPGPPPASAATSRACWRTRAPRSPSPRAGSTACGSSKPRSVRPAARQPPSSSMSPTAHRSPRAFEAAEAALGPVTILVNNAGVPAGSYFLKTSEERLARRDGRQSRRRVPRRPGGGAAHERQSAPAARSSTSPRSLGFGVLKALVRLLGLQGRRGQPDQVHGAGAGARPHSRQRAGARLFLDRVQRCLPRQRRRPAAAVARADGARGRSSRSSTGRCCCWPPTPGPS